MNFILGWQLLNLLLFFYKMVDHKEKNTYNKSKWNFENVNFQKRKWTSLKNQQKIQCI